MDESMCLPNGTLLQGGKYKIIRFISSGGFGCTYEAVHQILPLRYAIKEFFVKDFCNRDDNCEVSVGTKSKTALVEKLKKKFIEEARALCEFNHPGIVKASDVIFENGTVYFVMEYVDGPSLSQIQKQKGKIPEKEAIEYIRQVADALAYVHSHNRLHLDVKPGNILINQQGKAVLIDFGASKQYDEADGANTSTLIGNTPGFAPPEQMGNDVVKFLPATDVYALGATLYKLLTGVTPPSAMMISSGEEVKPIPEDLASPATRRAIELAMTINKHKRPQTMAEFMAIIDGDDNTSVCQETATPKSKTKGNAAKASNQGKSKKQNNQNVNKKANAPAVEQQSVSAYDAAGADVDAGLEEQNKSGLPKWVYPVAALAVAVLLLVLFWPKSGDGTTSDDPVKTDSVAAGTPTVEDMTFTNSKGVEFKYTGEVKINPQNGEKVPHGHGTGVYKEGTYVGPYENGLRSGSGAKYETKDKENNFEGSYKDDSYDNGTLRFSDNTYYVGSFKDNNYKKGTYYDASGNVLSKF